MRLPIGVNNAFQNRFEMQNHEKESTFGLNRINFGNRTINPTTGRFDRVDRFSEKYAGLSTFQYTANNPVRLIDINGDSLEKQDNSFNFYGLKLNFTFAITEESFATSFHAGLFPIGLEMGDGEYDLIGIRDNALAQSHLKLKNGSFAPIKRNFSKLGIGVLGIEKKVETIGGKEVSNDINLEVVGVGTKLGDVALERNQGDEYTLKFGTKLAFWYGIDAEASIGFPPPTHVSSYPPNYNPFTSGTERPSKKEAPFTKVQTLSRSENKRIIEFLKRR